MSHTTEEVLSPAQLREFKEFEMYFSLLEGRTDVKSRLMLLLNPDIPMTTTFLTGGQAHFVSVAHFMADKFPVFRGLKDFANKVCLSMLGVDGKGIDASVRLTGAVMEGKLLQRIGIGVREREGKEKE